MSDDSSSDSDCESDGEGSSCSSSSDSEVFDVIAEIKRKKAHPDRLHDELWYNDPGQVSLSPSIQHNLHDVAYKGSRTLYATLCNIVLKSTVISCHVTPSHSNPTVFCPATPEKLDTPLSFYYIWIFFWKITFSFLVASTSCDLFHPNHSELLKSVLWTLVCLIFC